MTKSSAEMVKIIVDSIEIDARKDASIFEAVLETDYKFLGLRIPSLYYMKGVKEADNSGVCVVEIEGEDELVNASERKVSAGMKVLTASPKVTASRTQAIQRIADAHDRDCVNCHRQGSCELQLLFEYDVKSGKLPEDKMQPIDESSIIVRNNNRCIRCGRCVAVCSDIQGIGAIKAIGEGLDMIVTPTSPDGLCATDCVNCGQCVAVCPVGALYAIDNAEAVFEAINDPDKFVVIEVAPAVRAALGEEFGFPVGSNVEGRIANALRELGFDKIFDTIFAADLTIMEEATEFLDRAQNGGVLPLMTSCCPGWVKYCEHNFPELLPNMSTCKSPQQMFGATVKSYYAEKMGISKENIVLVSTMPCTAKKFEIKRENECGAGVPDVDFSLTTRELARMIKAADVPFTALSFGKFDDPLGIGTGAGAIFGATGGVMEAALRTAVEKLTGEDLKKLDFADVRGMDGIKEASYDVAGMTVKVAVVSGLANAKKLLDKVKNGESDYQFIEIMACPGGCISGGGQPHLLANTWAKENVRAERASVLYDIDEASELRKSHENPAVQELYETFLGEPGSEKAHYLLHTSYVRR